MAQICYVCHDTLKSYSKKYTSKDGTVVCKDCIKKFFRPSKELCNEFFIDEYDRLFMVKSNVFKYESLMGFNLLENGHSVTKGGLGSAVAGGALFGDVGAVVGGITGKKTNSGICDSMELCITLKNTYEDTAYITFISSETKMNSFAYESAKKTAQKCIVALQNIQEYNRSLATNLPEKIEKYSAADEILKFKKLMDEGIISQDEFEMKKKQLLKL